MKKLLAIATFIGLTLSLSSQAITAPKEVIVGVYNNAPKIFLDKNGGLSGIEGELLNEIATREHWQLKSYPCEWQNCLAALKDKKIDLLPDVAITPERQKEFDFHRFPVLTSWSRIYAKNNGATKSWLDLGGQRIAAMTGSIQEGYLEEHLGDFGVRAVTVPTHSIEEGFAKVANGDADTVASNQLVGDTYAKVYGLQSTPIVFLPSKLFYATARGKNAELLRVIDRYLSDWQQNPQSVYFQTVQRWHPITNLSTVPKALWTFIGIVLAIIPIMIGWSLILKRKVTRKTRELQQSEAQLHTILDNVDAYIFIKDANYRYRYANQKMLSVFGCKLEDILGREDCDFFDIATAAHLRKEDIRVIEFGERIEVESPRNTTGRGLMQGMLFIKQPLKNAQGGTYGLCGIATNISRIKEAEQVASTLAYFHPLTQLPNRRKLLAELTQAIDSSPQRFKGGAVLLIDLDHFKKINDSKSHSAGDRLLMLVAERIRYSLPDEDQLFHPNSDEFVVVLNHLSQIEELAREHASLIAEKIQSAMRKPYEIDGKQYPCTASIGIALFCNATVSAEEILRRADIAMYRAKKSGRNRIRFFDKPLQQEVENRQALEQSLRAAVTHAQFVLHYQPQVNANRKITGFEVLLRWQREDGLLHTPSDFIRVAEETGIIIPLGHWIIRAACQTLASWQEDQATSQWHLAVNLSAHELREPSFVNYVSSIIEETGAPAHKLLLEITESQLIDNVDQIALKMAQLHQLGIRFSLDDFGTGYSSLSFLKRLPLDQLKIDKSFIRDIHARHDDLQIVSAILNMGHLMKLEVIAEGVETQAQWQLLISKGCQHFQGYLCGRPAPIEDYLEASCNNNSHVATAALKAI